MSEFRRVLGRGGAGENPLRCGRKKTADSPFARSLTQNGFQPNLLFRRKIKMSFKEFSQLSAELLFIGASDLNRNLRPFFQPEHNAFERGFKVTLPAFSRYQDFTFIGGTFFDQNSRRPAVNAGLILNNCFCFKHFIQQELRL